jgi:extracellular elastinolytic metalloproteinase
MMAHEFDLRESTFNLPPLEHSHAFHARAELVSDRLPGPHRVRITTFNGITGNPSAVISEDAPAHDADWVERAAAHVEALHPLLALRGADALTFRPVAHVAQTSSGAQVVHLDQQHHGVPIFEAALTVRFDPSGKIESTIGNPASVANAPSAQPKLSAQDAVLLAARHVAQPHPPYHGGLDLAGFEPTARLPARGPEQTTVLEQGPFGREVEASLVWFELGSQLVLAWRTLLTFPEAVAQYQVVVEATSGLMLSCRQLVQHAVTGVVYTTDPALPVQYIGFPVLHIDLDYHLTLPLPNDPHPLPVGYPDQ